MCKHLFSCNSSCNSACRNNVTEKKKNESLITQSIYLAVKVVPVVLIILQIISSCLEKTSSQGNVPDLTEQEEEGPCFFFLEMVHVQPQ